MKNGHVYIIEREDGCIKIGKSINPKSRIRTLETQGGFNLVNSYISQKCSNYSNIEYNMHKILKDKNIIGEWFKYSFCDAVEILKKQDYKKPYSKKELELNAKKILNNMCELSGLNKTKEMLKLYENEEKSYAVHCDLCNTPIELWKPLETYKSDDSCRLYSDFFGIVWDLEEQGTYKREDIRLELLKIKEDYPLIIDYELTINELIGIGLDTGIISCHSCLC